MDVCSKAVGRQLGIFSLCSSICGVDVGGVGSRSWPARGPRTFIRSAEQTGGSLEKRWDLPHNLEHRADGPSKSRNCDQAGELEGGGPEDDRRRLVVQTPTPTNGPVLLSFADARPSVPWKACLKASSRTHGTRYDIQQKVRKCRESERVHRAESRICLCGYCEGRVDLTYPSRETLICESH